MSLIACTFVSSNNLLIMLILVFRSQVLIESMEFIIPKYIPILTSLCLMYYLTIYVFLSLKIIFSFEFYLGKSYGTIS